MSTSNSKSKTKSKANEQQTPQAAHGADRPETIVEEQENESMSIQVGTFC